MATVFFRTIEILYGLFWLWSGLNAIFKWQKVPFISIQMDQFTQACYDTKFIMPTVKVVEILAGILFLFSYSTAGIFLMTPLVFGIVGLHFVFNPRPWVLVSIVALPYILLLLNNRYAWIEFISNT